MGVEIERKFLVINANYKKLATPSHCIQGYISNEPLIRVRIIDDRSYVTIKGNSTGITHSEYEYEVPTSDANSLLTEFCSTPIIEKYRYKIMIGRSLWEVDEFLGDNLGLVVAEIELIHENDIFDRPDWVGDEVSLETKYYNHNLTTHPFSKWNRQSE